MRSTFFLTPAMAALLFFGCATVSTSIRVDFPAQEGKLIPKETALEFVRSRVAGADENGMLLYSIEGSSLERAAVKISYKGEKTRHYGYYGLTVEVREYKWPAEKGKPFALIISGTAGPDTRPGRRIYWYEAAGPAKDIATALIALGAKTAP